jgi:hypothetical protein
MVQFHKAMGKQHFIKGHHDKVLKQVGFSPYDVVSMCMEAFMVHDGWGYSQTKQLHDQCVVCMLISYAVW